jgi:hypothetical protein
MVEICIIDFFFLFLRFKASLKVLLAGAKSIQRWFSLPLTAAMPSQTTRAESHRSKIPKNSVINSSKVLKDLQ